MNDPHVQSLEYEVITTFGYVFKDAPPLDHKTAEFTLRLEAERLTVSMKTHHATGKEARGVVEPFLRSWELHQALQRGTRLMRFEFQKANIIDRNPSPTASGINAAAAILCGSGSLFANATVLLASYPAPPLDFVASPHVETLWNRYEQYVDGREPLAGMAYACATFITRVVANGEAEASKKLSISR